MFEDCPRCGQKATVRSNSHGELTCRGVSSCGARWSGRSAYDRECVARGLVKSSLENEDGNSYITDGTFHEELQELTDIVAYNTLKEVRETLSMAIRGRERIIIEDPDEINGLLIAEQVKTLKGMEAWITGEMQKKEPGGFK